MELIYDIFTSKNKLTVFVQEVGTYIMLFVKLKKSFHDNTLISYI